MKLRRPDYRVSLPRSLGTSKIYTKGCSAGSCSSLYLFALEVAFKEVLHSGGHFSRMEVVP